MMIWFIILVVTIFALRLNCVTPTTFIKNGNMDYSSKAFSSVSEYDFELIDLFGLDEITKSIKSVPSLKNSASKFLLEVYNEIKEEENDYKRIRYKKEKHFRYKRALSDSTFITDLDREEIEESNNIMTFASRNSVAEQKLLNSTERRKQHKMLITFNVNNVPKDFQLIHSALRIYQNPELGNFHNEVHNTARNITISIYQKIYKRKHAEQEAKLSQNEYRFLTSLNTTTAYRGWLEFRITRLLAKWLKFKSVQQIKFGNEILVDVKLLEQPTVIIGKSSNDRRQNSRIKISAIDVGLVKPAEDDEFLDLQPFIIGYFNGPELMAKIQTLRFKREVMKRKRKAAAPPPPIHITYKMSKVCERHNFTVDFEETHLRNFVIAPKKFEAYFCGGECNFPLSSHLNATNHAIVQTLMHLKRPNLPKPGCVPTVLGSISLLHYRGEDSVNLSKYRQSVAKECGCH